MFNNTVSLVWYNDNYFMVIMAFVKNTFLLVLRVFTTADLISLNAEAATSKLNENCKSKGLVQKYITDLI